jgi:amidase
MMMITSTIRQRNAVACLIALAAVAGAPPAASAQTSSPSPFHIEEATIMDLQSALTSGQTTCQAIVQAYIDRAKAYNGTCTVLVTADGKPIPPAKGVVRAGAPLAFPTQTVAASSIFPNFSEYAGPPFEFGRMEPTISDASVPQQFGMRVGIPDAGQLNALETLNIRGERSVTCKGEFDRAPSAGPLPSGAPAVCEEFRKQPDALERAAELDKQYGTKPDLAKLPMYCAVFTLKNWYDAKDMRATGGNDVNYAMDAPKVHSPDIAELRAKGAIIYAVATANSVGGGYGGERSTAKTGVPRREPDVRRVGWADVQPVRHGTRAARHQQRIGRVGGGQPRDVLDLRAELRVLQGPGVA